MAVEYAPDDKRGYYGSWPQMGVPAGLLLANLVFLGSTSLFPEAWAWRAPFLVSVVLIGVGLFIRARLLETPSFSEVQESQSEAGFPIVEVFRNHPKNVFLAIGARVASDGAFYVFSVFVLSYAVETLRLPRSTILLGIVVASTIELFTVPAFGVLSDRIGRRPVYLAGAAFLMVLAYPYFLLIESGSAVLIILASVLALPIAHASMYGPMSAYFAELFGTRVRYSGVSVGYQLAAVFGGGLAPLIGTYLVAAAGGASWPVAVYIIILCVVTLVSVFVAAETFRGGEFAAEQSGERRTVAEQS